MAIIGWPDDVEASETLFCAICKQEKMATEMTVGLCDAQEKQAFACDDHFRSGDQFIMGWTDFIIDQQLLAERASG